jgi:hypothetical protein
MAEMTQRNTIQQQRKATMQIRTTSCVDLQSFHLPQPQNTPFSNVPDGYPKTWGNVVIAWSPQEYDRTTQHPPLTKVPYADDVVAALKEINDELSQQLKMISVDIKALSGANDALTKRLNDVETKLTKE